MASPWHFGNTTVRNPLRIRAGLIALKESLLNGHLIGQDQEKRFAELLDFTQVVSIADKSRDYSDLGRKWRSCFSQLGFITHKFQRDLKAGELDSEIVSVVNAHPEFKLSGRPYEITLSGLRLIEAESLQQQQECMLRALLAYEVPSVIEQNNGDSPFKPFFFVLQTLRAMESKKIKNGISKVEMAFLQACRSHDDEEVQHVIENILQYRDKYEKAIGVVAKRRVDKQALDEIAAEAGIQGDSLIDYADLNFRYLRYTGLVSFSGKRLVLNELKAPIIDSILSRGHRCIGKNGVEYLSTLWAGDILPTDDETNLRSEILRYQTLLRNAGFENQAIPQISAGYSVADLNQVRIRVEEMYHEYLEINYAQDQREPQNVGEIIAYLKKLDGQRIDSEYEVDILDKPSYLEWAVWRAFLAINSLENKPYEARRFKVDQDFYPMGCAPGRGPDMMFVFDQYALVVEVTLTSSSRQEAAEGEPVRRHVADEKKKIAEKLGIPVYGLFLAGNIDNNTAETFRIGVWYNGDTPDFINIVPLTLNQFIRIMELFAASRFSNAQFRRLLDMCLIPRNAHAPAWKNEINKSVEDFIHTMHH